MSKDADTMHSKEMAFVTMLIIYQNVIMTEEIVAAIMSKMDTVQNVNVLMKNKVNMKTQVVLFTAQIIFVLHPGTNQYQIPMEK